MNRDHNQQETEQIENHHTKHRLYKKIHDIVDTDLEKNARYLAGLMDGEGTFSIIARITGKQNVSFSPCISLKMTHKETVEFAADIFGVNIFMRKGKPGHKDTYDFRVTTKIEAQKICNALSPFSKTKMKPIDLLSNFLLLSDEKDLLKHSQPLSSEVKKISLAMVDLHISSKKANQRGTEIIDYEAMRKELKDIIAAK
jgi:hypothetical protein